MPNLWTPWRLAYITSEKKGDACIFCAALASHEDEANLVIHRGERAFVLLNRYPYNNGHVMVAPNDHVGALGDADPQALAEVMRLATLVEQRLSALYKPQGFNLGMNLGALGGSGCRRTPAPPSRAALGGRHELHGRRQRPARHPGSGSRTPTVASHLSRTMPLPPTPSREVTQKRRMRAASRDAIAATVAGAMALSAARASQVRAPAAGPERLAVRESPQVLETVDGIRDALLGRARSVPLPTVFLFATSLEETLAHPVYGEIARRLVERGSSPWRSTFPPMVEMDDPASRMRFARGAPGSRLRKIRRPPCCVAPPGSSTRWWTRG